MDHPENLKVTEARRYLRIAGVVGTLGLIALALVVGHNWSKSTAKGWGRLTREVGRPLAQNTRPKELHSGSRVVFQGATVAVLTTYQQISNEKTDNGVLWIVNGTWESTPTAAAVRMDTTLSGVLSGIPGDSIPMTIELFRKMPSRAQVPSGLLRLQPFATAYHVYSRP